VSVGKQTAAANDTAEIVIDEGNLDLTVANDSMAEGSSPAIKEIALAAAAEGMRLFPLGPGRKSPPPKGWQTIATTDASTITGWLTPGPACELIGDVLPNIGVLCGNRLLVLDLDPRNGSDESFTALEAKYGKLPLTRTARTPSGGTHFYFRVPSDREIKNNNRGLVGKGIDVKSDGGYVVLPASSTEKGTYQWIDPTAPIADLPAPLLALVTKPRTPKEPSNSPSATTAETPKHNLTVADAHEMLKHLDPNCDYNEWFEVCVSMNRAARGAQDGSQPAEWFNALDDWSKGSSKYPGREAVAAKWAEAATRESGYGLRHLIKLAKARGYTPPVNVADPSVFKPTTTDPGTTPPPLDATPAEPKQLPPLVLQRLPEDWQLLTPQPRRWIVADYLSAATATLLISLGGLGKSYLTLFLTICVALGIDFCGKKCAQGRVVIVSGEDDFNEIWRRLIGLAQHLGLLLQRSAVEQLRENIEILDVKQWRRAQGGSPVLTKSERGGAVLTPFVGHLARNIGKANVVVIDTVSRFNGAEENSNDAAARLIDAFEIIAEETQSAVLALAHTGIKGRTEEVNQYSSRGASAFSDNARSVLVLAPLSGELVDKITDPSQYAKATRNDLLRLCHTKSNYAKRADDVYFERQAQGVLVPVQLKLHVPTTEGQLVERLIEQVGTGEVTRNTVRTKFADWFGPTVTREQAFSAFDKAVHEGRLVLTSERNNAKSYRAKPSAAANEDLVSERCVS
jgi:RecA-family ATPase